MRIQHIDGVDRACFDEASELEEAKAYRGPLHVWLIRPCVVCGRELFGSLRHRKSFIRAICPDGDHLNRGEIA
jgi:hypothetical protein